MSYLTKLASLRWAFSTNGLVIGTGLVILLAILFPAYSLQNVAMAFGIAIDIFCATLSQFHRFATFDDAKRWARRCMITHTAFPMLGCTIAAVSTWALGWLEVLFGFGAAYLVYGLLLVPELRARCGWTSEGESEANFEEMQTSRNPLTRTWGRFLKFLHSRDPEWVKVMAVSMDALFSGPAKFVFAVTWSVCELAGSFPLVGYWVALFAILGVIGAFALRRLVSVGKAERSRSILITTNVVGFYLEFLVIGFFACKGVLQALTHFGSTVEASVVNAAAFSATITIVFLVFSLGAMVRHQGDEAAETVQSA